MRRSTHPELPKTAGSDRTIHFAAEFSEHERVRRIRRHGSSRRGRWLCCGFFVVFVALDLAFYFCSSPSMREWAPAVTINDLIWMTSLFVGLWLRQMWARFILAGVLLIYAFVIFLIMADFVEGGAALKDPTIAAVVIFSAALRAICGWMLISWRDFRRLTSRAECG